MIDGERNIFNVARQVPVSFPSDESERCITVRLADWNRLKRKCAKIHESKRDLAQWWGLSFGLAGSGLLALIPLLRTQDLSPYVVPSFLTFSLAAAVVGVIILRFECIQLADRKDRATEILEEMREVECTQTMQSLSSSEQSRPTSQ